MHCDLPALCLTALRFAALLARDVPAHDLRLRRERTPEHLLQCSVQVSTLPGVPVAQSPRDFARILHSWPWTSRVGSAVRPAIVSCLLHSYSWRLARIFIRCNFTTHTSELHFGLYHTLREPLAVPLHPAPAYSCTVLPKGSCFAPLQCCHVHICSISGPAGASLWLDC